MQAAICRIIAPGAALCLTSILPSRAPKPADTEYSDAELKLVQVVFRHGARSPLTSRYWEGITWDRGQDCGEKFKAVQISLQDARRNPAADNPWDERQVKTVLPGGCSKGELTLAGQQQAYNFGSWLRQRYIDQLHFLPAYYQAGILTSRSTNYARTKATLQGVLTGLYDTKEVIPVVTATEDDEILISSYNCAHLTGLLRLQTARLREEASKDARVRQLDEDCREALGLVEETPIAYTDLYDALTSCQFHGKGWPAGMTDSLYRRIELEAVKRMAAIVSPGCRDKFGANILKLSSGQLFNEMSRQMDRASEDREGSKMLLYSGHDTTIMPVLSSLIGDLVRWPPYLSSVVIELWKRNNMHGDDAYFVTASYNCEQLLELNPDQPGVPLTFKEFKSRYWDPHSMERDDFLEYCKKEVPTSQNETPNFGGDSVQGL